MPAFVAPLILFLTRYLIARLLVGAGLTFITFTTINSIVQRLENSLQQYLASLPSSVFYVIDLLQFDFYISVLISCYSMAIGIKSAKIFLAKA